MRAAFYEGDGPARSVLSTGERPAPEPCPDEVRVRVMVSGVNPSAVKSRMAPSRPGFPLVIPHGAGVVDAVGQDVDPCRAGERLWLWNAQWRRAFGTAAEHVALPSEQAVPLPDDVSYELPAEVRDAAIAASRGVLADHAFKHLTAAIFPLDRIVEAHEAVEAGSLTGNLLVGIQ